MSKITPEYLRIDWRARRWGEGGRRTLAESATTPTVTVPTVRSARPRDLDAIAAIERASFPAPWPREAFAALLDTPGFPRAKRAGRGRGSEANEASRGDAPGFLVAEDDHVLGFVVGTLESCDDQPCGHLKDLAVAPHARRRNIGRRLCRAATDRLHDAGASVVGLEVRPSNRAALACYRAVGFSVERREPAYYDDGEDAYLCVHRRSD